MLYVFFLILAHEAGIIFVVTVHLELKEAEEITSAQHNQARLHGDPHGRAGGRWAGGYYVDRWP